jgi:hypothetical protein
MADSPPDKHHDREEYLEQDEEEREAAGRNKSVIALGVMAVLVVAGIVLVHKLKDVSDLQDCLMTRATNCTQVDTAAPATR